MHPDADALLRTDVPATLTRLYAFFLRHGTAFAVVRCRDAVASEPPLDGSQLRLRNVF